MIPKAMHDYLYSHLPETAIRNRTRRDDGLCFLELGYMDEHLLSCLGITRDALGPKLVACLWDEASSDPIGGYLVVDNLSMGSPSMGGIRMLPDITPVIVHNLARGMTLKNGAANLPYGGGKSGIVSDSQLAPDQRQRIIQGFARLIRSYRNLYVPGPDVGTNDQDMKIIACENGLDSAVSKPADMGGNRIDEIGAAAGGVITALERLLEIMPRLTVLPQFANLKIPSPEELTVLIQGFGAVGAHVANFLTLRLPSAKTVGISDKFGYIYDRKGLATQSLFNLWCQQKNVTLEYLHREIVARGYRHTGHFSTNPDNLLRESAFCAIPAAPIFNYLGVLPSEDASLTVDGMGDWSVIIEGANTYSPDPNRKAARTRMEQVVYRQKGVMIATDYLVNSGGVIFAAHEHIIPTPAHLQISPGLLGNAEEIERWLEEHADEFAELSKNRLQAGEEYREKVIRRNMTELVDMLSSNPGILPCQAAERISLQRLSAKESERTAKDIMIPIPTIMVNATVQEVSVLLMKKQMSIAAVLSPENKLVGVVTTWDITRAIADGSFNGTIEHMMTRNVVYASPLDSIIDIVRELEQHQISAMPVVDDGNVLGMVNTDLLAHRYLLPLLQSNEPL